MRFAVALLALLALALPLAGPARAADRGASAPSPPSAEVPAPKVDQRAKPGTDKPAPPKTKQETVEELLQKLVKAQDKQDAHRIEQQIEDIWSHSGSPTADLLLRRSRKAMEGDDDKTAAAILEKLTKLDPDFAEGWHQRAEVAMDMDDYQEAIAALHHTLALQPKHFGALAELGQILEDFGDKAHALEAYREAIKLDPFIDGLPDRIRELSHDVEGQGI